MSTPAVAIGIKAGSTTATRVYEHVHTDGSPNTAAVSIITTQLNAKTRTSMLSAGAGVGLRETLLENHENVVSGEDEKSMEEIQNLDNKNKHERQDSETWNIVTETVEHAALAKITKLSEKGCATLGSVGEHNVEKHDVTFRNAGTTQAVLDGGFTLVDNAQRRTVRSIMRGSSE